MEVPARLEAEAGIGLGVALHGRGGEHLASLGQRGDPGGEHDVAAEQLLGIGDDEAGVQADPDGERVELGRAAEGPLQLQRGMQPGMRAVERGEEAIALEPGHPAVVPRHQLLHQQVMVAQPALPAFGPQPGGRLARIGDVAEHQGHGAVGRAEAAERGPDGLERGGDHVDRGELCRILHCQVLPPPLAAASIP